MKGYTQHTDQQLTEMLRSSDHMAYTEIYNRYNGLLCVFALKRLQNRKDPGATALTLVNRQIRII